MSAVDVLLNMVGDSRARLSPAKELRRRKTGAVPSSSFRWLPKARSDARCARRFGEESHFGEESESEFEPCAVKAAKFTNFVHVVGLDLLTDQRALPRRLRRNPLSIPALLPHLQTAQRPLLTVSHFARPPLLAVAQSSFFSSPPSSLLSRASFLMPFAACSKALRPFLHALLNFPLASLLFLCFLPRSHRQ